MVEGKTGTRVCLDKFKELKLKKKKKKLKLAEDKNLTWVCYKLIRKFTSLMS